LPVPAIWQRTHRVFAMTWQSFRSPAHFPMQSDPEQLEAGGDAAATDLLAEWRVALRDKATAAALEEAVCRNVDESRRRGAPVERVVVDLKRQMRLAGAIDRYAKPEERLLAESVIRWCIQRYFGRAD